MHGFLIVKRCYSGSKGYSFATWLRLEDADAQPGTAGRALFTLLHKTTEATRGVSAAFKGASLPLGLDHQSIS